MVSKKSSQRTTISSVSSAEVRDPLMNVAPIGDIAYLVLCDPPRPLRILRVLCVKESLLSDVKDVCIP